MNLKWTPKQLTLVIIPDANRSVIRLRVPHLCAYTAAAVFLGLLLVTLMISGLHAHTRLTAFELKNQLAGATSQLQQTEATKNQTIQQLQNEVIQLSQQADQIKSKVEEMKKIEKDLKTVTEISLNSADSKKVSEPPSSTSSLPILGEGGSIIPVTQEEILKLGDQTQAAMVSLNQEMDKLHGSLTVTKQKVAEKQTLLRVTPSLWPTESQVVTSSFGYRRDPITLTPSFHSGIDIGAGENEPAYATADGKVISTGTDPARGNHIIIGHANDLRTLYMHLNKILVNEGDPVGKGQTIGLVGSTGRSTGPHLHYQVLKNGVSVDPKPYLQTTRKEER
jgi:murein DD-endopeptidase MepM/ murein hydrolase activator NlpD